jgi:alkanesulfonate monooxygenase SsuD/methylene tetrahydromethanopterin reductase-like flavin-dependent oxidoreductase (luciferase family)
MAYELPEDQFFAFHGITIEEAERRAEDAEAQAQDEQDPERFIPAHLVARDGEASHELSWVADYDEWAERVNDYFRERGE